MNTVLQTSDRHLVSITTDELVGICNSLNEICNNTQFLLSEFETRLGVSREVLEGLLSELQEGVKHQALRTDSQVNAWSDVRSIQVIAVTVFGDPIDMSCDEARAFLEQLAMAISEAES